MKTTAEKIADIEVRLSSYGNNQYMPFLVEEISWLVSVAKGQAAGITTPVADVVVDKKPIDTVVPEIVKK